MEDYARRQTERPGDDDSSGDEEDEQSDEDVPVGEEVSGDLEGDDDNSLDG